MLIALSVIVVVESVALLWLLARRKPLRTLKPSQDLSDFLKDMQRHGYGVIRINPDDLLLRSPRMR